MKRTNVDKNNRMARRVLILLAAVITAIAVAVTCALCIPDSSKRVSVDNVQQGTVSTSASYTTTGKTYNFNVTTGQIGDNTQGQLINGDVLTFTTASSYYGVTLPKGTYKLEAWGAQGGSGCSGSGTEVAGAQGGYAYGTYEISAATTFYIYIGGQGSSAPLTSGATGTAVAGGYNGGGASGSNNYSTYYQGGGGGGATHISKTQALLASHTTTAQKDNIIMVAGGGGGSGYSASYSQGTGGGETGTTNVAGAASGAAHCATGGSQTEGGQDLGVHGSRGNPGTFGQGGAGATASAKSGGGGGGGGYYGGAGGDSGNSTACGGGGGGSGYLSSAITDGNMSNGGKTGNGQVTITVVKVHEAPVTKNYTWTLGTREGFTSKTINASDLASDPEGTAVHFSNGTKGDYDANSNFTTNSGLWLDSACSISASRYFTWTTTSDTSFTINSIVAYPRAGQTGVSATGGTVTLYTYIRDSYGTRSAGRECTLISFTLTVSKSTTPTRKTTGVKASVVSNGATNSVDCLVGSSVNTPVPGDPTTSTTIYNPSLQSRQTLFVKKMLVLGGSITLTASDLLSGVSSRDKAIIALTDTTNISGGARKFKVNQLDNITTTTDKVTAYSATFGTLTNTFSKITIECVTPTPGYQVLPITIYVVENTAVNEANQVSNVTLWDSTSTVSYALDIVFKMENTRPVLKSGVQNVVDVGVGETKTLKLNDYFSDVDNTTISTSTHTLLGVELPKKEFLALDRLENTVTFASPNANYYNIGNKVTASTETSTFLTTAQSEVDTGFVDGIVYNAASGVGSLQQSFMSYTVGTDGITVTGLRASFSQYKSDRQKTAPGHFYLLIHLKDLSDPSDNGIWLPIAFTVGATTSYTPVATVNSVNSQTASGTFPNVNGSAGQSFYFAPMALNVNGSHVIGQYKAEDEQGNNTGALTSANLQALALDGDNFATETGTASWNGGKLNELLQLNTTPQAVADSICGTDTATQVATDVWQNQYFTVRYVDIYIPTSLVATSAYANSRVVVASGTPSAGFNYVPLTTEGDYFIVKGLKITLRSATMNRYIYALAKVKDVTNKSSVDIKIAIRVKNTAPQVFSPESNKVVTFGNSATDSSYSTYKYAEDGVPTITYKVPLGTTFMVTPYDFAYDYDMTVAGVTFNGGFSLNGYSGRYNSSNGLFTANSTAAADGSTAVSGLLGSSYQSAATALLGSIVSSTTVANVSTNAAGTASTSGISTNQAMYRDRLFFDRVAVGTDAYGYNPLTYVNSEINYSAANVNGFVNVNFGTRIKVGTPEYNVDFMLITAINRTSQQAVIELTVRDRYGNGSTDGDAAFTVRIQIEVVNTKPNVKDTGYYKELSVRPIVQVDDDDTKKVVAPDTTVLYANGNGNNAGIMEDRDKDTPEFVLARGVAIVNKSFIDDYKNDINFSSFAGLEQKYLVGNGVLLTRYISAELLSRRELSVTAYSSTKAIEGGVYVAFFATDNNGGISLGYVQIEVLNTAPTLNESEANGFNSINPMWYIESASDADITRNRYIVGSESAYQLVKSDKAALDIDIKLIATDEDALHNKTVLSQVSTVTENSATTYVYPTIDITDYNTSSLEQVIPSIDVDTEFNGTASAVKLFTRNTETGQLSASLPANYTAVLNFYVPTLDGASGDWYTRSELITALTATENKLDINRVFDGDGRFKVSDWALLLRATLGFDNIDLGISLSVRDQAELGGSTAGLKTAFNSDRNHKDDTGALDNKVVVEGNLFTTVYQHINKTGIRTINEFLGKNDNYYTVEYAESGKTPVRFVSTYDGDTASTYAESKDSLYYDTVGGKVVLSTSGNLIKSRANSTADGTLAGTNSGAIYDNNITQADLVGAFKYTDTIELPAAVESGNPASGEDVKYRSVYVPMSYFGLLSTLVTPDANGNVTYPEDFVGYEVNYSATSNPVVSLDDIETIVQSMVLSDGSKEWRGAEILSSDNPYFTLEAFDWYHDGDDSTNSSSLYDDVYSRPYYNNRLAVATLNPNDNSLIGFERTKNAQNETVVNTKNANSFVGDGRLMYIEDQATMLVEHNFGLVFTKKNVRTSTRNLSLTINLARYNKESNGGRLALTQGKLSNTDRGTVEIKIHIENSKLDLFNNDSNTSNVKYDSAKGTYYVDVDLASSETATYKLQRRALKDQTVLSDTYTLEYYDDDYGTEEKRDFAYFSSDSFNQLSQWQVGAAGYNRVLALTDDNGKFVNVASESLTGDAQVDNKKNKAQKSVANYFGVSYGELAKLTVSGSEYKTGAYKANNGIYGSAINMDKTTGKEGFSSYFNASVLDNGTSLSILPVRKTFINEIAFGDESKNLTVDEVKAAYLERGLIAEYNPGDAALSPSRVYYPFKVLIYDSFGAGFTDASYVALEFRVSITNGTPTLKTIGTPNPTTGGRQYTMSLAVGNSARINLYDIVYDSDMFTTTRTGVNVLATQTYFETNSTGVVRETGDYLASPLDNDQYKNVEYLPTAQKDGDIYYYNGGGFVEHDPDNVHLKEGEDISQYNSRDVVMWMSTDPESGNPYSNEINFTVNRRTMTKVTEGGKEIPVSISQYRFTMRFYDGTGAYTAPFTFIIKVTNQAPSLLNVRSSYTMRSGDDITLLTTYYDYFTGESANMLDAYRNSETYTLIAARQGRDGYGKTFGDGHNNATGLGRYWKFADITSTAERGQIVPNATIDNVRPETGSMHLGYVGLANDDTPWKLRIIDVKYNKTRLRVEHNGFIRLAPEFGEDNTEYSHIAVRVVATGACTNEPVTITLSDGEGGLVISTLYFTVVSSPPVALDSSDESNRAILARSGLEGIQKQNGGWEEATYRMFIIPSETPATFNVEGFDDAKTARRVTTVSMSNVARDPDENETDNMRLYGNGNFTVNGDPLVMDSDGVYRSTFFNIKPSNDGRSFDVIATGYDPDTTSGYDVLSFVIEDYGNPVYANRCEITLHIYTLYSDLTNPTAATTTAYDAYLGGSEIVDVKSYDTYYDPTTLVDRSVYAFMKLKNNDGDADNQSSPIVDVDATEKGDAKYDVRLYAFVNVDNGVVKALDVNTLKTMLERNGTSKMFKLKDGNYTDYLIGGLVNGSPITRNSAGNNRYDAVTKFADFEFDVDGTAIMFTPKASTLNSKDVLLYVEVEKPMGLRSVAKRQNAVLNAGTLFSLNVKDSKPQVVDGTFTVEGVKGDIGTFTVHNPQNRYDALFTDSDNGDAVTVAGMVNGKLAESEYANVMSIAEKELPDLDWKADPAIDKPRAFDLSTNSDGELEIKINRRVDYTVNGVYQSSVTIPLCIVGEDKCHEKATTTVYLTIKNSDISAVEAVSKFNSETQIGYGFEHTEMGEYVMSVKLRYGAPLDVNLSDLIVDNDSIGTTYDADSLRFVNSNTLGDFIVDEPTTVKWYALDSSGNSNLDDTRDLATAEPIGADKFHRTGIRFNAIATERDLTATVYVRVIDRSGDAAVAENGITIRINVIVMNDAPYVLEGKETTTLYMIGSQNNEPEGMLFFIGDFVADHNTSDVVGDDESYKNPFTYLRISAQDPRSITQLYSNMYETIPESFGVSEEVTSAALFEMTTPAVLDDKMIRAYYERKGVTYTPELKDTTNNYNQWFVIKPRKGFYGNGAIDITVMDGNPGVKFDTLYTTFCIEVHVISNADEVIDDLSAIELACSKTRQIDIRSIMPDIENKLVLPDAQADSGISTSADGSMFNQYAYYNIVSIGLQNEIDKNKATFTQLDNDGQLWEIKAGNQVTRDPLRVEVKLALKSDSTKTYTKYFYLNIIANRSPKSKYSQIEFKRYSKGEADALRDLNEANSIRLEAWQLFDDPDDPDGTAIRFLNVESQVSSIVKAKLIRDDSGENRYLELSFVGRGESEITVTVTDETGTPVKLKFTASNTDLPQASMWVRLAASFEANTVLWIVIIGCVLLLIVILIIIIAVVRKRKRAREELEALLVSEMEIEEQMLKLAGGPAPTNYQSFGYLQGAPMQSDPSMMLGAGEESAQPQLTALPPAQGENGLPPTDDGMPM